MPRPPDRSVSAYDRWAKTEEATQSELEFQEKQRRLRVGRRLGQRVLRQRVTAALRLPDRGLLERLNAVIRWDLKRAPHPGRATWLETLALTLISAAGRITPEVRAIQAAGHAPEDRELGLILWEQSPEWRLRLRYCDYTGCPAPFFLARSLNRRDRYCTKAHEQLARRGRSRFKKIAEAIPPGRLVPPRQ